MRGAPLRAGIAAIGVMFVILLLAPSHSSASLAPLSDQPDLSTPAPSAPESDPFAAHRKLFNIKSFEIEEEIIRQEGIFTASGAFFEKGEGGEKLITKIDVRIYLTSDQWSRYDGKNAGTAKSSQEYRLLEGRILSFFQKVYPSPPIQYTVRAARATLDAKAMKKKRQKYAEKHLRVHDLSNVN